MQTYKGAINMFLSQEVIQFLLTIGAAIIASGALIGLWYGIKD